MKKKWTALLLAMLLSLSILTSCGSGEHALPTVDGAPSNSQMVAEQPANTAESDEDISGGGAQTPPEMTEPVLDNESTETVFALSEVPAYNGEPYVAINGNTPYFTDDDLTTTSFETYSPLDDLGRCGVTYACVGQDIMPTEERGSIGQVKPTGWHTVKYDCVDGKYLYNRCHLIGFQLTGENANEENLITGTRYLNIEGMLPFENMVADYVQETNNHVLYRVTPIFEGENLLASGVLMEGYSVEDEGAEICFCVYAYNVQPSVTINYATGDSALDGASSTSEPMAPPVVQEPTTDTNGWQLNNTVSLSIWKHPIYLECFMRRGRPAKTSSTVLTSSPSMLWYLTQRKNRRPFGKCSGISLLMTVEISRNGRRRSLHSSNRAKN